ncbi:exodeoxyribonuclease VII large subunit [Boudabousia liubingyangii]|uniref:Exodeoxyribonuclease 7 large subunit n=2 Tax=Boudabousia liubingyangii TaxID=1921764 RepID=A0A1Q5PJV8_9ACTO|nr:exodeoxyribonuclease VII large subunit [Boudabousia liubingyangii]
MVITMESTLAPTAAQTTRENPWPLRLLSQKMKGYIEKMSPVWVEGEVVELKVRPGNKMSFLVLGDLESDASINVALWANAIAPVKDGLTPGSKVVVRAKPTFWERTGSLQLQGAEIHLRGLGDLLARIELLRQQLAAEGLFAAERKQPLPFLPRKIGLICGQGAKAEQDVIVNARLRWPGAVFETRYANVQGDHCAPTVTAALQELDQIPDVDVIIITRGGGAVADLLPFSDERIVRAAANAKTPIIAAIGHETDCPLLDLVADYRASTPTDAARKVVPDLETERAGLQSTLDRARQMLLKRLAYEQEGLKNLLSRPSLASPEGIINNQLQLIQQTKIQVNERLSKKLELAASELEGFKGKLKALSPQEILNRGYAVIRKPDKSVITDASELSKGALIEGMLAQGSFVAQVIGAQAKNIGR